MEILVSFLVGAFLGVVFCFKSVSITTSVSTVEKAQAQVMELTGEPLIKIVSNGKADNLMTKNYKVIAVKNKDQTGWLSLKVIKKSPMIIKENQNE